MASLLNGILEIGMAKGPGEVCGTIHLRAVEITLQEDRDLQ